MQLPIRRYAWQLILVLFAPWMVACTLIHAQEYDPHIFDGRRLNPRVDSSPYRSYFSFAGRAEDRSRLHTDVFLPLLSTQSDLLFADVRGQVQYGGGGEGNWGLAYRHLFEHDYLIGVYGFYDLKRSASENTFHQGTFGVEFLSDLLDVRWNGYLPEGGSAQAAAATAVIADGNLVVQNNQERAYYGTDAEIGVLLWRMPEHYDSEIRLFAGLYHFDTDSPTASSFGGPRFRAELRSFDLPFLALDSRLTFGVQYQHDDVRDSQTSGTVAIRMPFGPDRHRHRRMTRMERRMTDVIVRDVDVVTEATPTPGGQEVALHARYDFEIGSVTVLNAKTENLPAEVAAATTDAVIIDGAHGDIELDQPIQVQPGQILLGGGLRVKGADTGVQATFGSSLTLTGTDPTESVILTADTNIVSNFNIVGGLHGISSLLSGGLEDLDGVIIVENNVTGAADSGFRFGTLDINSVIGENRATGNGNHGFDIAQNQGSFDQNNALGNVGNGFNLFDNEGTVTFNRSLRNEGFGFFADDNSGSFDQNESYENELSGYDFLNNSGSISGNLSADNQGQGFTFTNNAVTGLVEGNQAFDNGSYGFDFQDNEGTVRDNLSFANRDSGFEFADNTGLFERNIATSNDGSGFDFNDNLGLFLDNESDFNLGDGFLFNENVAGGLFQGNIASDNLEFGYNGTNNGGTASDNTGAGNADGNDTFP